MPKVFTSKSQKTGEIGEHVAVRYLKNKGFNIVERNYTKKWGEIDIVAQKGKIFHFVEVKSKTNDSLELLPYIRDGYRPEDNMHFRKTQRLKRTIQTYLAEHKEIGEWRFDLVTVYLQSDLQKAKVELLEHIII